MSRTLLVRVLAVMVAIGLAGCDSSPSSSSPTAPSAPQPAPTPIPQPAGTELAGTVADGAWRPLVGATVEVLNGPHAGRSTATGSSGGFRLSGTFDETTQFRASKDGYVAAVRPFPNRCDPCNPNWWIHFSLESLGPKADIAGNYSLTFTADNACRELPDEMRTRTYDATVTPISNSNVPANTLYKVTVSGALFHGRYNAFDLGVSQDYLSGFLGDLHGDPGIVEQIAPTTYLAFEGIPSASIGTSDVSTIVAAFDGAIDYCERKSEMGSSFGCRPAEAVAQVRCVSKNHQLILRRR